MDETKIADIARQIINDPDFKDIAENGYNNIISDLINMNVKDKKLKFLQRCLTLFHNSCMSEAKLYFIYMEYCNIVNKYKDKNIDHSKNPIETINFDTDNNDTNFVKKATVLLQTSCFQSMINKTIGEPNLIYMMLMSWSIAYMVDNEHELLKDIIHIENTLKHFSDGNIFNEGSTTIQ